MADGVGSAAEELYGLPPEDFVAARDARVAQAREQGDRELARSIGRLRRPTQAAWLANLLARHRREQLAALVELAGGLADAQRTLDGPQLRALANQRHQLVASMADEARALAQEAGYRVTDTVERDLQGILDAALAQPEVAEEVLAGRLDRTVSYTGFGPEVTPGSTVSRARAARPAGTEPHPGTGSHASSVAGVGSGTADGPPSPRDRAAAAALAAARRELDAAEQDSERTRRQREAAQAEHAAADERHAAARARVVELTATLETARREERTALAAARTAARPARETARAAQSAAARVARARARLDEAET